MTTQFLPLGPQTRNLVGERFGNLVAVGLVEIRRRTSPTTGRLTIRTVWLCQCDCGRQSRVTSTHLRTGHTLSCGCRQDEQKRKGFNRSHGLRSTPEYRVWADMKQRCENPRRRDYARYGGRGIIVCPRWIEDFPAFLKDMGLRPSAVHTLERVDNEKGYHPDNCEWATYTTQANNKRNNRIIEAFGCQRTVAEWAREIGINARALRGRLDRGIAPEVALTAPWYCRTMRSAS